MAKLREMGGQVQGDVWLRRYREMGGKVQGDGWLSTGRRVAKYRE